MTSYRMPSIYQEPKETSVPIVDTVIKAFEILDCFTVADAELSLSQLCHKTGLNKSRVYRLCATLTESGFLIRSESNYRLGPKLLSLGKCYEQGDTLSTSARPFMRDLTRKTGESTALYTLSNEKCLCLARQKGTSSLIFAINEGDYVEVTPTAAGRVFLAYSDETTVNQLLLSSPKTRFTALTKTTIDEIRVELSSIRRNGYGLNMGELERDITAIAAPVFQNDQIVAALSIIGPAYRFCEDYQQNLVPELIATAQAISRQLYKADANFSVPDLSRRTHRLRL